MRPPYRELELSFPLLEEDRSSYQQPDFRTILSVALRWLIEIRVALYFLHKRNYLEQALYDDVYDQTEWMRVTLVQLKDSA